MPDPTTPTAVAAAAAGVSLATLLPGIDGNALIGAFAGAALVAISSKEPRLLVRAVHVLISLVMGYLTAPEIVAQTPLQETGVAAFAAAALIVTLALWATERIKTLDLSIFTRRGG
ncbi:putative holin [Orrella sp. JC864]|uniref:putative holin n=1 Tax=Orrella sp. JC864 TaxID=3120298 RepID=UPI00300A6BAA